MRPYTNQQLTSLTVELGLPQYFLGFCYLAKPLVKLWWDLEVPEVLY